MWDLSRSKVFLLRFLVFVCKRLATTHLWAEYDFQINIKSLSSWLMPHSLCLMNQSLIDLQTSFWKSFLYFDFPWSPVWLEYSARLICHMLSKFLLMYSKKALLEPSRWWTLDDVGVSFKNYNGMFNIKLESYCNWKSLLILFQSRSEVLNQN